MAGYYMLLTLNTSVCECVGIMPSDEPPPAWSPSPPPGHATTSKKEEIYKLQKFIVEYILHYMNIILKIDMFNTYNCQVTSLQHNIFNVTTF